jgi:hypothetical protein
MVDLALVASTVITCEADPVRVSNAARLAGQRALPELAIAAAFPIVVGRPADASPAGLPAISETAAITRVIDGKSDFNATSVDVARGCRLPAAPRRRLGFRQAIVLFQRAAVLVTIGLVTPLAIAHAPADARSRPASGSGRAQLVARVSRVNRDELRYSYRSGCPVGPSQLRLVRLRYWGFDQRAHLGSIVVNATDVQVVVTVFDRLYAERFPIRRMQSIDAFKGSDAASMAADNTSGFNCRYAVASGPRHWSVHAYGEAIDVNPVENPYLEAGTVHPPAGTRYLDRAHFRPGMAVAGGQLVAAFQAVGWYWGGRWTSSPDYQHFSATGG